MYQGLGHAYHTFSYTRVQVHLDADMPCCSIAMASCAKLTIFLLLLFLELSPTPSSAMKEPNARQRKKRDLHIDLDLIKETLKTLSRQVMEQQNFAEERIRTEGDSGVKQMRQLFVGTRSYHAAAHAEDAMSSIHEHANLERTVGMGEIVAVLNGVEFRTRHNDYRLVSPSHYSSTYHATDPIPYPHVPPSVTSMYDVDEEIMEMKEYFRAFKEQDPHIRDYKSYFRPVLCYLEGAWTTSSEGIDEPFFSETHFIDAKTWKDLDQKNRYTMYSGRKEPDENVAFLPRKVFSVDEDGLPEMAQWNYRILCHPLPSDIPTSHLRVVDDLGSRMCHGRNLAQHANSRHARFQINPDNQSFWKEQMTNHTFLDYLMEQIPGKNNYVTSMGDSAFDTPVRENTVPIHGHPALKNTGFYHRYYRAKKSPESAALQHRGFSDANVFMAMTDHPKVVPTSLNTCNHERCTTVTQRWSYAIPLELIYLTPLFNWNPYEIQFKGHFESEFGKTVTNHGKRDGLSPESYYNGINSKEYYMTPAEFIDQTHTAVADTSFDEKYVMDTFGIIRHVAASGQRIFVEIPDVGKVRLRYPVAPLYGEGNAAWKEIDALKDILLYPHKYFHMFQESIPCNC